LRKAFEVERIAIDPSSEHEIELAFLKSGLGIYWFRTIFWSKMWRTLLSTQKIRVSFAAIFTWPSN